VYIHSWFEVCWRQLDMSSEKRALLRPKRLLCGNVAERRREPGAWVATLDHGLTHILTPSTLTHPIPPPPPSPPTLTPQWTLIDTYTRRLCDQNRGHSHPNRGCSRWRQQRCMKTYSFRHPYSNRTARIPSILRELWRGNELASTGWLCDQNTGHSHPNRRAQQKE